MTTVALYHAKGGVGKTSAAVNLSYLCAAGGHKTLLWDLDPQASATFYCKIRPKLSVGVRKMVKGSADVKSSVKHTEYENLDLLPAAFSERKIDIVLSRMKKPKRRIRGIVDRLEDRYRYLFIDCPPGFTLLSDNIFRAADIILIPLIPTTLSIRTYVRIMKYFSDKDLDSGRVFPFFSLVDRRKKMHRETVEAYTGGGRYLRTSIPYSSDIEKMGATLAPVLLSAPRSKAAEAYRHLWEEVGEIKKGDTRA